MTSCLLCEAVVSHGAQQSGRGVAGDSEDCAGRGATRASAADTREVSHVSLAGGVSELLCSP